MPSGIYIRTEEHKRKISIANTDKKHSEETKRKIKEARKRQKRPPMTEKHKQKLKKIMKGNKYGLGYKHTKEAKIKIGLASKGKKYCLGHKLTEEHRRKVGKSRSGEKSNFWKGGITPENARIRSGIEFRLWRESVFARDNWICQKTKIKGGKLHPHHIQNFAQFPELRLAIDNGITLSEKAHREFHKKYGIKNNTKEQIEEFLENSG